MATESDTTDDPVTATVEGLLETSESYWTFSGEAAGREAMARVLACAIVWSLPSESMDETVEELVDIYRFYDERQKIAPANVPEAAAVAGVTTEGTERAGMTLPTE